MRCYYVWLQKSKAKVTDAQEEEEPTNLDSCNIADIPATDAVTEKMHEHIQDRILASDQ